MRARLAAEGSNVEPLMIFWTPTSAAARKNNESGLIRFLFELPAIHARTERPQARAGSPRRCISASPLRDEGPGPQLPLLLQEHLGRSASAAPALFLEPPWRQGRTEKQHGKQNTSAAAPQQPRVWTRPGKDLAKEHEDKTHLTSPPAGPGPGPPSRPGAGPCSPCRWSAPGRG